jgi:uncharacterized protein
MGFMDLLTRRVLGVPGRPGRYRVRKSIPVPTRDGFHLLADHYAPESAGASGTILLRGPYGRAFPTSAVYGGLFAGAGYHVVIQSVRGTFGSTGVFNPLVQEADDAQDAVAWLRSQEWFDGRLATVGGSYLGFTQWALLADPPAELRAAVVVVGPHDFGRVLHGTGVFTLSLALAWSEAMTSRPSLTGGLSLLLGGADRRTRPGLYGLPLAEAAAPILAGKAPWYHDWLLHEDSGDPTGTPAGTSEDSWNRRCPFFSSVAGMTSFSTRRWSSTGPSTAGVQRWRSPSGPGRTWTRSAGGPG